MPRTSGSYRGLALSGLSQTSRCAQRREPRDLGRKQLRIAPIPAVGEHHDHRAATEPAAVSAVELGERVPDPRAARPVGDRVRGALERRVGIAAAKLGGDPT